MRRITWAVAALAIGAAAALPAQDSTTKSKAATKPKWEFSIAPYVLFSSMQGTNTVGSFPPFSLDASASDIFSHLQGGAMLYFEAKKGDWAFATDAIYMKLAQDIHPDGNYVSGTATLKQGAWEAFVLYRFNRTLEVGLGGLANKIDVEVNATVPPSGNGNFSRSISWGLPVLAMRWTPWNTDRWSGLLFADYGGTSGKNWSWQLMPSVGYKFSHTFELALQYRYIAIDYATGSGSDYFGYRMNIFGPQIGFLFHL